MDYSDVGRHIDPAVFLCGTKAEHVVILVDRAADRAQRVVTVGQYIGKREFLHSGSAGCLNDADKSNIMRSHRVKSDLQMVHVS